MQHIGSIIRKIPTQVLQGKMIPAVMDGDRVVRPAVVGMDTSQWSHEGKREVEKELKRRKKRAKHSHNLLDEINAKVIPSGRRVAA